MTTVDFDVMVVGYGPVGQTLSALLGRAGHRVGVFERYGSLYGLPRAVRLDGEVMRVYQGLGIVGEIEDEVVAADHYLWLGADGEPIVDIDMTAPHPSGWRTDYLFYQPAVEEVLDRAARSWPTVSVERGWQAETLAQHEDHVEVTFRRGTEESVGRWEPTEETRVVRARYVVGADGATSFVREACGIGQVDHGFAEKWLVADVRPNDMGDFEYLPDAVQYCEPSRPHTAVRNGGRHRRWEFMLLEGDSAEDLRSDPARVWEFLEPWIRPEEGTLVRHAVYEFRSLVAETMRKGRALLAGDSAHLMPPFMGEGAVSGLRDANNLAWKLDLILRGISPDSLLDAYTPERRHQNEATVMVSLQMGQVSCTLDPEAAVQRDAAFRSGEMPPPPPLPGIGDGVLHRGPDGPRDPVAGTQGVQGRVDGPAGVGLLDDVYGPGFAVVCAKGDPQGTLADEHHKFLQALGAHVLTLDPEVGGSVRDVDGRLTGWLTEHGLEAVVCRPDFYVFGGVSRASELPALVEDLRKQVSDPPAIEAV